MRDRFLPTIRGKVILKQVEKGYVVKDYRRDPETLRQTKKAEEFYKPHEGKDALKRAWVLYGFLLLETNDYVKQQLLATYSDDDSTEESSRPGA